MMTVQEAAEKWGVNENTVRRWAREGRLKAIPLADFLKQRGLPAPKRPSWMIDQNDRPALNMEPVVRAKAVPEETASEEAPQTAPVNGWW